MILRPLPSLILWSKNLATAIFNPIAYARQSEDCDPSLPVDVQYELKLARLLYYQLHLGNISLVIYMAMFIFAAHGVLAPWLIASWSIAITAIIAARMKTYRSWNAARQSITNLAEIVPWMRRLQTLILIGAATVGTIGFFATQTPGQPFQIFSFLIILFISCGAVVCYSMSPKVMYSLLLPSTFPLLATLLTAPLGWERAWGVAFFIYGVIGTQAGAWLGRYVQKSLRLGIENSRLAKDLREQISHQDQAQAALNESETRLRMAIESSAALIWDWDLATGSLSAQGDLMTSVGIVTRKVQSTFAEYVNLVHPSDRKVLLDAEHLLSSGISEIDFEHRVVRVSDGAVRSLAIRGKGMRDADGTIRHVAGIAIDITDRKTQQKLRHERDIHEAANKAKSVFLANASHEIRTPLAAINGFAETILQNGEIPSQVREDLQVILRNGRYLASLVNDLLDLSKIETGRLYLQKSLMSVESEINDAVLVVRSILEMKRLRMDLQYLTEIPAQIQSDPTRFRQIMINLLTNAAKFTNSGGIQVRVSFEPVGYKGGRIKIAVSDTGIGMPADVIAHLFEPFIRGTDPEVQRVQGSGLGLALSRDLARWLGGDIRLIRSAPQKGSEFEFTVESPVVSPHRKKVSSPSLAPKPSAVTQLEGVRILVVDDSADLRTLMKRYIERAGGLVELCNNGREAVEKAMQEPFDAILMDIKMPVMDGYHATHELRKRGYLRPIIALTAHASTDDRQLCYQVGCDDYICKPVDTIHLYEALARQLKSQRVSHPRLAEPSLQM